MQIRIDDKEIVRKRKREKTEKSKTKVKTIDKEEDEVKWRETDDGERCKISVTR